MPDAPDERGRGLGHEVDSVSAEEAEQVLIGIAPVVGTARVVSAAGKIARALGFAIAVAEAELEEEEAAADD